MATVSPVSEYDPQRLVESYVVRSGVEASQKYAVFAGQMTRRNPWVFCFLCLITVGLYACLRKKHVGGILVTARRVIHVVLTLDASNNIIAYEQTSYFVRNFAHETHAYTQPVYTCGDWLCCIPCCDCICFCRKPVPTTDINLYFFSYPATVAKVRGANASQICISCCLCCCKPCIECGYQCCGGAGSRVKMNRVWLRMEVDFKDGLRNVTNMLAAIMYYHPAQYTQRGKPWHHHDPHPRLATVNLEQAPNYMLFDEKRIVPVDPSTQTSTSTWGLVEGEFVYDGFAGRLRLCSCTVCCLSLLTLGIWLCIIKINYDNCASIRREYFLVTDRRLIRYTLHTTGAKTVPRLNDSNGEGVTEFYLEVSSWMLTAFTTYRYTENSSCLACCGHCCCCAKKDYFADLYTAFGKIRIEGRGANAIDIHDDKASKDQDLEKFLKGLMYQTAESPLHDVINNNALAPDRSGRVPRLSGPDVHRPGPDEDVMFMDAEPQAQFGVPRETLLAHIRGRPYGNCCVRCLCCVPCRILTCCCCPRERTSDLYITTQRLITSATIRVPCCGRVLDSYTEYYNLSQVKRMIFQQSYKCNCCGACSCCPVSFLAIDTDLEFEESEEGHETYTVEEVTGVEGGENLTAEDKVRIIVAALSIMNTHEEWILKKRVLELNLATQLEQQVVPTEHV